MINLSWFLNKIGILIKYFSRVYWDLRLSKSFGYFNKDVDPTSEKSYKTQSIDYLLLKHCLNIISFRQMEGVQVADIGCGAGRLLAYLNFVNPQNFYFGYELNEVVGQKTKDYFSDNENVTIKVGDALTSLGLHEVYILFNPFPADIFNQFLEVLRQPVKGIKILYINASELHVRAAQMHSKNFSVEKICINVPINTISRTDVVLMISK